MAWLYICFIEAELFLLGIIVAVAMKYIFFSPNYIKDALWELWGRKETWTLNISGIEQTPVVSAPTEKKEVLKKKEVKPVEYKASPTPTQTKKVENIPQKPGVIESFFAENLIAKIGGIILFLWVLTFLIGIYSVIGPVAKIVIWFIIGFSLFAAWVFLDKKWFENESRIVMGVAILVNYLVILWGRHFLGDDSSSDGTLLSSGITFIFLILNTLFAVVVSLVYSSRNLLIFAFAAAYINPLLIGSVSSDPYNLLSYTMIVTFGAMYMSFIRKEEVLFPVSFVLASIMILIAPWSDPVGWVTKLLCINLLGAIALYVSTVFQKTYKLIYELLIGATFFLIGIMGFLSFESLSQLQLIIMWASALGLMVFCYFFMHRGAYLYSLGTLGTILTLSPALMQSILSGENVAVSIIIIWVFAVANLAVVLMRSKQLIKDSLWNLMTWLISGAIFLGYMVYITGNEFFPGMLQWLALICLAAIYASISFLFIKQLGIEEVKKDVKYQNVFYSISALSVSFFSLAIALIFSENPEVISIIWLLEASVLFFVSQKLQSTKIAFWGLVLFVIGIFRFLPLLDMYMRNEYGMLAAIWVVVGSLLVNLYILFKKENNLPDEIYGAHNVFHIIWISAASIWFLQIIDIANEWVWLLYVAIILNFFSSLYRYIDSKGLVIMSNFWILGFYCIHILANLLALESGWFSTDENIPLSFLILSLSALPFIYEYKKEGKIVSKFMLAATCLYGLSVTSLYVIQLFEVTFALTLYWWVLAFGVLGFGISKDILYMRTIWLYLLCLTVWKIFLYDIWQPGVDDGVWFIAFMLTGILMIVLSTMYTRKYGNTLGKDFSPANILTEITPQWEKVEKTVHTQEQKTTSKVMQDIKNVDTNGIVGVRMKINGVEKPIQIRAENLVKITKLVTNMYGKTSFKAWELQNVYDTIETQYKSQLPASQYKRIKEIVKSFVDHGGEIEFVS